MQYQRKEVASGPTDTDALDWDAQTLLNERVTMAIGELHISPEGFFLAGIGGFLARLRNQPSITLNYGEQRIHLTMDGALAFRDLLAQVKSQLVLAPVGQMPGSIPQRNGSTPADASFQVMTSARRMASSPSWGVPLGFMARIADNSWELSVTNASQPQTTTERILSYLSTFLKAAAENPDHPAGTLLLISEPSALELYRSFNQAAVPFPDVTIMELFSEKLAVYSSIAAVRFGDSALTYAQLDAESNVLAGVLIARGADQDHPVAVCIERSEKIPVVLLATLKAGSYFVPIDPSHPRQRLLDMLEECKPAVVIVSPQTQGLFAGADLPLFVPSFDTTAPSPVTLPSISARDKAYMIYTSGTTGRPKGVMIPHGALKNFLLAMRERPGLGAGDHLLAVATLSFDMSILDMFLPLASGATLVIASEHAAKDPWELAKIFESQGITCMQATPVTWRMLLSSGYKGTPKLKVLIGGEALSRDLANELALISGEIWNCYGPTETTVYSSVLRIEPGSGPVPIGPPMANTAFYVTDPAGNLLPPEIAGELSIGGAGVALGYYERPELNRERFIADPWTPPNAFTSQPMLFRTGDQVRLAANGKLAFEFFGRLDHQVKLRGYRIELGEIEVVLRTHAAVADAAVLLREDEPGEPWLVAYITPQKADITEAPVATRDLLDFAASRLPVYMLPSRIVSLPALPLTGSGKVDKRALGALPAPVDREVPDAQVGLPERRGKNSQPLDALETSLLRIFRDTLRLKSFGPDENFFEHGGYSMLAIRLFAKIGTTLHKQLPITALFDAPTVRKLAELIRRGDPLQALVPIREHGTQAPFFLVHSYLLYGAAKTIVESDRPVYGLRERSATAAPLDLQRCVTDYSAAIQRAWPTGIVHLGGWCAAATLTIELARRLADEGRQVGMVALFDAEAPGFVALPQSGSPLLARLRAMRTFHLGRMRSLSWSGRLLYINERLTQAPLNMIERFYLKHHARIERWQRSMRWLPSVFFYNRFTQIGHLQTDHIDQLDTRIQLFRARDVTVVAGSDAALGWGAIGHRGVEVSFIPGHHESMFLEPNVDVLRDEFQAAMRSVEAELALQKQSRHD